MQDVGCAMQDARGRMWAGSLTSTACRDRFYFDDRESADLDYFITNRIWQQAVAHIPRAAYRNLHPAPRTLLS